MKKFIPLLLIVAVVVIFFRQFFLHFLLPIPSDDIVGLYYPFRDIYRASYPRGLPFKNFLITDPVRQQYPWRFESILQIKNFQLPLWNPYEFAGNPLLANQQSAVFNPFNIFFFVAPFPFAWSMLIFLQPLLTGLFLFFYLRNQKLHVLASLLGATGFIFSGFFVSWMQWGTIDMTALWLPLVLLSIDKIFLEKKYMWYSVYFFSCVVAFFAGHLQTFMYLMLCAHVYILLRLFRSNNNIRTLLIGLPFGLLAIGIASIQWIPLFQLILLSGRNADLTMGTGWFIPYQNLISFFAPDFFGNPVTLNYWGVWNYAELTGYVGIPVLLFALYSIVALKNKTVWFFWGVVVISLLFALPTTLANLPLQLHIPFLSTAQPTRLLFLICFSLVVLASFGMDAFMQKAKKRIVVPLIFLAIVNIFLWVLVNHFPNLLLYSSLDRIAVAKHNLIFPLGMFVATLLLVVCAKIFQQKRKIFILCICVILFLSIFDGLHFADKFTPFTQAKYLFPQSTVMDFLQKNAGNFRVMTTDDQILPPNFSVMYHVQSIDGYDPLYIKQYGELAAAIGRNKPDISEPFGFNRIITPHDYSSRLIDLLGVKYVLSLAPLQSPKLKQVFQDGQTIVYENTKVFPRAFFATSVVNVSTEQEEVQFLFDTSHDLSKDAVAISSSTFGPTGVGDLTISSYNPEKIVLQTHNNSSGFLVLTDIYYPTWHAFVDGKETKIYPTDLTFRGILVPSGKHTVVFVDELF